MQTFQTDMKGEMFVICMQCIAVVWEEAGKDGSAVKRSCGAECVGLGSGAIGENKWERAQTGNQ